MTDPAGHLSAPDPERPGREDRLESWKEIAAYLQRDVRTVQRWEKTAGLPVHRHAASRLRTAYAHRSELDAWWSTQEQEAHRQQESSAEPGAAEVTDPIGGRRAIAPRVRAAAALIAAVALTLATGVLWSKGPAHGEPPRAVTILQTPLESEAADRRLGAMLDETIAHQLAAGPGVELVAPVRAARTLRLMRRNPETELTPSIGREVCVRDGRVNFLLAGTVRTYQSRYFVDLDLIDPSDGSVRRNVEAQADAAAELLAAVRSQAEALGGYAAELAPAVPAHGDALEEVTTSSLRALRLYTAAVTAGDRRQWAASEALARRAVAVDEQFAAAHAWVGWSIRRQGRPAAESLPPLERAMALSSSASEPEGYVISGMFHDVGHGLLPAAAMYEAALRLQPHNPRLMDLLIEAYASTGRFKDAVDLAVRRAEMRPEDFYANVRAAHALMVWQHDRTRADAFIARSRQLATRVAAADRPFWAAWLGALSVFDRWLADDVTGALAELAALQNGLDRTIGRERDALATTLGWSYLALGKAREAEHLFRAASTPVREINLAMQALSIDDRAAAREWLLQVRAHSEQRPALFASVGLVADAERGLAAASPSEYGEGTAAVTRGLIAARQDAREEAMTLLRRGRELLRFSGQPEYFLATEALARMLRRDGRPEQAERLIAEAAAQRPHTYAGAYWTGAFWLRLNAHLLSHHRRARRSEDAVRLAASLRQLTSQADADHPIVRLIATGGERRDRTRSAGGRPHRAGKCP